MSVIRTSLVSAESPRMAEYVDIALADLIVDSRNARLKEAQPSQPATLFALAGQQKRRLLNLAEDIVRHGLDPTTSTVIVPADDRKQRYVVIEGNRRTVALKALETPTLVAPALDSAGRKRLNRLAERFAKNPITSVPCVLFESESGELEHWVTLRHTGQNNGVGLVDWGAEEKDRYAKRHGRHSSDSPAGQILEFVQKRGGLTEEAQTSDKGIITSLRRLVNTPEVRKKLGIDVSEGRVSALYPANEIAKSLTRVVEDLKTGTIKVGDIYHSQQRIDYAEKLAKSDRPDPSTRLTSPTSLDNVNDASDENITKSAPTPAKKPKKKQQPIRTTLIPKDCYLNISSVRINNIYVELRNISIEEYPNAVSVSLRVFVELSVDHYLKENGLSKKGGANEPNLAKRPRTAADDLEGKGRIDEQLRRAVHKVAGSHHSVAAGTVTFNQYVHNSNVIPTASELRSAWDELEPFIVELWS